MAGVFGHHSRLSLKQVQERVRAFAAQI